MSISREDFAVTYELDRAGADTLQVVTYRDPAPRQPSPAEAAPAAPSANPFGFFSAEALLAASPQAAPAPETTAQNAGPPKTVIVLFDISLSMQWEKLERSYQALETLLRGLQPSDKFSLILFNSQTQPFQPAPVPADPGAIQRALEFVKASRLRGGTNLQLALDAGLQQCAAGGSANPYLVLLSDGGATRGPIQNGKMAAVYESSWKRLPAAERPKTYIFGVGDDANLPLLTMLSRQDGVMENVLSTEPIDFKLNAFLSKIGRSPVGQLRSRRKPEAADRGRGLSVAGSRDSLGGRWPPGSAVTRTPQAAVVTFTVRGVRDGGNPLAISGKASAARANHSIMRNCQGLWARARVDASARKNSSATARTKPPSTRSSAWLVEYKFVTPYTSFLAVPRALLRPRVIRPGDPPAANQDRRIHHVSVVALFPFGPMQKLRFLPGEDTCGRRAFSRPPTCKTVHTRVRLVLRDHVRECRIASRRRSSSPASRPSCR
jgi:Ca-activated chloride channel family protein